MRISDWSSDVCASDLSQWSFAYGIASKLDDAYLPGTDVSTRPIGERDDYTSLAWLAGSTAFYNLGKPLDAMEMFRRYATAAKSPQTQSKGFYWAGRAALQAGDAASANSYFARAGAFPDQFYGQLALRSEEHTSELQSLMRISYAVFCLKKKKNTNIRHTT